MGTLQDSTRRADGIVDKTKKASGGTIKHAIDDLLPDLVGEKSTLISAIADEKTTNPTSVEIKKAEDALINVQSEITKIELKAGQPVETLLPKETPLPLEKIDDSGIDFAKIQHDLPPEETIESESPLFPYSIIYESGVKQVLSAEQIIKLEDELIPKLYKQYEPKYGKSLHNCYVFITNDKKFVVYEFRDVTGKRFVSSSFTISLNQPDVNEEKTDTKATIIAQKIVKEQQRQRTIISSGRIYTRFDLDNDILEADTEHITKGLFSDNHGTLDTYFTSSAQSATFKTYAYELYQSASIEVGAAPQFSVQYGHAAGSGSAVTNQNYVTKAVYSQYKQLLLEPSDNYFTFNGVDSDSIYVINFNRSRMKEKLDPGNVEVCIAQLSGSSVVNNVHTGSNVQLSGLNKYVRLIDDSGDAEQSVTVSGQVGSVYNIISGSISAGAYPNSASAHYYGLVYPEMGVMILDANTLNLSASFNTVTGSSVAGDNAYKLFTAISGAAVIDGTYGVFTARNYEKIESEYYFVRIRNKEYNFSNNPSWTTGSLGKFKHPNFVNDPKVYLTTVGMYNDRYELLAVAKLSKPLIKSFKEESLIKVRLKY